MSWQQFLRPDIIVFLIPISAILVGGAIAIVSMVIKHRERMSMIEQGINPDRRPDEEDADR
ncbi:MAG: hypothetical protein JXB62_10910 [Pirellulales bacterium]|nr:hypothetical protein [Pirellulales bacterium]